MFSDKEAAAALRELSLYCEENRCSKCIFRTLDEWSIDHKARYSCILGYYHLYKLRAVTTNGEIRVVTEEEALNNEN